MTLEEWEIDTSESTIELSLEPPMASEVKARFTEWDGAIFWDEKRAGPGSVVVDIDAASIRTGDDDRDKRLMKILEAERYPRILFQSTGVDQVHGQTFQVDGLLTIKNVVGPMCLEARFERRVEHPGAMPRILLDVDGLLDRAAFGLTRVPGAESSWLAGRFTRIAAHVEASDTGRAIAAA